jgi:hypothetical protein
VKLPNLNGVYFGFFVLSIAFSILNFNVAGKFPESEIYGGVTTEVIY